MSGPTRRQFLTLGLAGGAILALGTGGLFLRTTALRPIPHALATLSDVEYSIVAALADRICPGGNGLPTASDLDVAGRFDALLDRLDPAATAEIKSILPLFENALIGLLLDQRFSTFTNSTPEVQDQVLLGWRESRFVLRRTAYKAMVALLSSCYWSDPKTHAFTGYNGPPTFALPPARSLTDPDSYFEPVEPPPQEISP